MSLLRSAVGAAVVVVCTLCAADAISKQSPPRSERSARFVELPDVNGFLGFYNLGQGTVRILALVSPTCPQCRAAFDEIQRIMETISTNRLRAYIVFQPVRDQDRMLRAFRLAVELNQPRVTHFWDPTLSVSARLKPIARSDDLTESRCYVFPTNAMVTDAPDEPTLVMDPHASTGPTAFDGEVLEATVRDLLARFEAEHRRGEAARR
jgi:hypothetical protein